MSLTPQPPLHIMERGRKIGFFHFGDGVFAPLSIWWRGVEVNKIAVMILGLVLLSPLHAASPELDAAIAGGDEDKVIEVFKTRDLAEEDVEKINEWIAGKKEKYRKRYLYAIRDKAAPSPAAGKHLQREVQRLIKENLVEDDLDFTVACLTAAATNKNTDLIYVVAPFLVHPQAKLRSEANKVVAVKKDERVYPLIGQLLAGENAIDKIYAMETLLALKDERAVPLLLLQISNPNKNVRYFTLKTLEAINSEKSQHGVIHAAEADSDEEVRLKATEILRYLKTGPVFSALQKLIGDKNLAMRALALESALFQKNKSYANAISEQLARETEHAQKHALLRALLTLGSGGGMNGVLTLLKRETDQDLLLWSAYACNRFNESKCADALVGVIANPQTEAIMVESLSALGTFKQKKHLTALFSVLQNEKNSELVRAAALVSIREYDTEAAILPLFELYTHEKDQPIRVQVRNLLTDLMRRKLAKI
jgi:HEAT repeat protein